MFVLDYFKESGWAHAPGNNQGRILAGFHAVSERELVQQEASSVHSSRQLHLQPSSWSSQLDTGRLVGRSEVT